MEPEARHFLVDSAVLVLIALLAAAIVWLSTAGMRGARAPYLIYFEQQSVAGLQVGSAVTLRGVPVGSVRSFGISHRRPGAAVVRVDLEPDTPVRASTRAAVERELVTGIASIALTNLDEHAPLLARAPPGEPYPVIAEGTARAEQLSASLQALAQRSENVLAGLEALLSRENRAAVAETLDNLRRLSREASATAERLQAALASLQDAAEETRDLSRSVREETTVALREATAALRALRIHAERLAQRAAGVLATGEQELRATGRALRRSAEALEEAGAALSDPGRAFLGPPPAALGPGEDGR